jgi:hypothetical protein
VKGGDIANNFPEPSHFSSPLSEKTTFIFAFRQPFSGPDDKIRGKTGAVQRLLMTVWRGANLPYFGKQGHNWTYSPREQERGIIRGFPVLALRINQKNEPLMGLFFFRLMTPFIPVS